MIAPWNFDKPEQRPSRIRVRTKPEYKLDLGRAMAEPGTKPKNPNEINIILNVPIIAEFIEFDLKVLGPGESFDAL